MMLFPEINEQLRRLESVDVEKLEAAAVAMENAGIDAGSVYELIADTREQWHDAMLARQELKDGNF